MELLHAAEAVARDKGLDRDEVIYAMEEALRKVARTKYGHDHDIRVRIDRRTETIVIQRCLEVVDEVINEATQISLANAQRIKPDAVVGDLLTEDLPPIDLGRVPAQTARQVIIQEVRAIERRHQYLEFKDRVGEIISGIVKRVEYGNITLDIGRGEAVLRREEALPREHVKVGDRLRAYIYDVREEPRGAQVLLSRTHPLFMARLFTQEVPEIYDGVIEIKAIARDPGSRAKMAVISHDNSIDPVGACVGMRGSRVQAVVGELQGERVDIIPWASEPATFVVNALAPAEITRVVLDEEKGRMDVVVPEDQLSLAIGRRGQNVRLASMLTGWNIDILTEQEESIRRAEEMRARTALFIEALEVDDIIATLLVAEGFTTVEDVAETPADELAEIEGFDLEVAEELRSRAGTWLVENAARLKQQCAELGVADDVLTLPHMTAAMAVALGNKSLVTRDDIGDLSSDELIEIVGAAHLTPKRADEMIVAARAHWFVEEEADDEQEQQTSQR